MAFRISFSFAMNQYVVGGASVEVLPWRHSMTRGCATIGKVSIVLWYRAADVEISGAALSKGIRGLSEVLMETEV
jgi:hypothetical protein